MRKMRILILGASLFALAGCNQAFMEGMAKGAADSMSGRSSSSSNDSAVAAMRTTCIMNGGVWLATGGCLY